MSPYKKKGHEQVRNKNTVLNLSLGLNILIYNFLKGVLMHLNQLITRERDREVLFCHHKSYIET